MRGKHTSLYPHCVLPRITPAGAGKTVFQQTIRIIFRDHPRRCGENPILARCFARRSGSPPQVRGKQNPKREILFHYRITPAGAGKTDGLYTNAFLHWDHPRRCGENLLKPAKLSAALGSPPQVRGKHMFSPPQVFRRRITPAGAGKTLKRSFRNQPFCS